jgi:hypothetical protein
LPAIVFIHRLITGRMILSCMRISGQRNVSGSYVDCPARTFSTCGSVWLSMVHITEYIKQRNKQWVPKYRSRPMNLNLHNSVFEIRGCESIGFPFSV